jgi:hypothetical protein
MGLAIDIKVWLAFGLTVVISAAASRTIYPAELIAGIKAVARDGKPLVYSDWACSGW